MASSLLSRVTSVSADPRYVNVLWWGGFCGLCVFFLLISVRLLEQKFILRKNTWVFRTVRLRAELQSFCKLFHSFQISAQPCPLCFSISVKPVLWKFICFSCAQEKQGSFCSPGKQSLLCFLAEHLPTRESSPLKRTQMESCFPERGGKAWVWALGFTGLLPRCGSKTQTNGAGVQNWQVEQSFGTLYNPLPFPKRSEMVIACL